MRGFARFALALGSTPVLAVVGWLLLGHAGWLSPADAAAGPGDVVVYHATARDSQGLVRFTTDPDVATREIRAGNPFLVPVRDGYPYFARRFVASSGTGSADELATHLLHARAGEARDTGLLADPLGPAPTVTVRRVHGGYDLRELEAELGLEGGARTYAAALDANVTLVASDEPGRVAIAIDVAPGDRIHPRACRLPIGLPSANLTVVRVTESEIELARSDDPRRHAYGHDLAFELRVLEVIQAHDPRVVLPSFNN